MISRFFIDRPIFASVISMIVMLAGAVAALYAADRAVPRNHAADAGLRQLSRGQRRDRARHGRRPDRAAGQRRGEHALHVVAVHQRRQLHPDDHLPSGHRSEHGPGARAEPRTLAMPIMPDLVQREGVAVKKKSPSSDDDRQLDSRKDATGNRLRQPLLSNYATIQIRDELAPLAGVGDVAFIGQRDYSMRVWLTRRRWPRSASRRRHPHGERRTELSRSRRAASASSRPRPARPSRFRSPRWGG